MSRGVDSDRDHGRRRDVTVKECGSILFVMLVLMSLGIFMLLSIEGLIKGYLLQERQLRSFDAETHFLQEQLLAIVRSEAEEGLDHLISGGAEREDCRLFGDEWRYLSFAVGVYRHQVNDECDQGEERRFTGYYWVSNLAGIKRVQYLYALKNVSEAVLARLESYRVISSEEGVQIAVEDLGQRYQYQFLSAVSENKDKNKNKSESEIVVLRSSLVAGFLMLSEDAVWWLPRGHFSPLQLQGRIALRGALVVSDRVDDQGVYLLTVRRLSASQKAQVTLAVYPWRELWSSLGAEEILFTTTIEIDSWKVLREDFGKVVFEISHLDKKQLLSIRWGGEAAWGNRYLWTSNNELVCGLQSEVFEPIAGWVLGCQRKDSTLKIDIED